MYYINPMYYLFALPALILGFYAQFKVRQAYNKYVRVANRSQMSGQEAAQRLLTANGLDQVGVEGTSGVLSDHYDPRKKTLFLSQAIAQSPSVASLGIVAHEVGHATQDAQNYMPLKLRSAIVPVVQIGSWLGPILFLIGMLLQTSSALSLVGILLFSSTLVFALVTLPVEFDASRRAIAMLQQNGLVSGVEEQGVRQVLSAAALTYVAAAAQALSTLLYYLTLFSGSRRRR